MTQSFSFLIVIYEATKQFLSVRYVSSIIFFGNNDQLYFFLTNLDISTYYSITKRNITIYFR